MKFIGAALVLVGLGLIYFIYKTPIQAGQSYTTTIVNDLKQFFQGNTTGTATNTSTPTIATATGSQGTPGTAPTLPSSLTGQLA